MVVDAGADDGQVRLTPATQAVDGDRVVWVLTNGGPSTLTLRLVVHAVEATAGEVEIGAPAGLSLGLDTLTLASGEAARIPLDLDDDASPRALALVARTANADPETTVSGLVLVGGSGAVEPRVVGADANAGTFTVHLDAEGPALVNVALRATAWPGVVRTEQVVEGVLVPTGGRDLDVALDGLIAGRVAIDVVVGGPVPTSTSAATWWWPTNVLLATVAVALLLTTLVAILLVRRRRVRQVTPG